MAGSRKRFVVIHYFGGIYYGTALEKLVDEYEERRFG